MLPTVVIGGVDVAWHCVKALAETGRAPRLVVGYPPSLARRSGYVSFADLCSAHGIELLETEDANEPEVIRRIAALEPRVLLVLGWSQLVGAELLGVPAHGAFGLHPTPLPVGRGRAPIPWSIIKGLRRSAVTLFRLTEGVDDGPIVAQAPFEITQRDDAGTVYAKVRELSVRLLLEHVDALVAGTAEARPQEGEATYWPRRRPEDGKIDWTMSAERIYDWIRAHTHPYPGAFTALPGGRTLRVWSAGVADQRGIAAAPGTVLGAAGQGLVVATGTGAVALQTVELDGGREVPAGGLLAEGVVREGDVLG